MEAPLAGWRPDVYTRGVRASDRAYLTLREEIIEGALAPGSVLGEVEQSARLGLSRTPLREALGRLVADGLAEQSPRRGIVVTAVSLSEASDLFEVRSALEVLAARRAAENVAHQPASTGHSPRELLADLAVRFETATVDLAAGADPTAYYALTEELDAAIDSAAGNRHLADALRDVRVHLGRLRRLSRDSPGRLADSAREHAAIARAVATGNPQLAAATTTVHLQQALTHLLTGAPAATDATPSPQETTP